MKYLLVSLVLFEITDGLLTHFLIVGGLAREGNPLLQPIVGEITFLLLKVGGGLLAAILLWDIYQRWPRVALVSTTFFVMVYSVIVLWNVSMFLRV